MVKPWRLFSGSSGASFHVPPGEAQCGVVAIVPSTLIPRAAASLIEWLEDPKVQVLHFAQERANLAQSYGPFFWKEKLTPAQSGSFLDHTGATVPW